MSSPKQISRFVPSQRIRWTAGLVLCAAAVHLSARAALPEWLQHIVGATSVEAALYRVMHLPGADTLYPRPPKEAAAELEALAKRNPDDAQLYELRARADEQALDETAAERDWKLYAAHAKDAIPAKLELADFYERRMLYPQAIATLKDVASAPSPASETYLDPAQQRSWIAMERVLTIIDRQGMPASETAAAFDAFLARYPDQPAVYAAAFQFEIEQQNWAAATTLLQRYRKEFPSEAVFPVRAQALLEFRRGNVDAALAVYDKTFHPLWDPELIRSYLALLEKAHRQRAFVSAARAQLAAHPDGPEAMDALARIFYYDQEGGRSAAALETLEAFRVAREARHGAWSADDLSVLAQLSMLAGSYAEAARYDYALASTNGTLSNGEPAAQRGLADLTHILLQAPEQPLAVGAGNLTMYRDIATLDRGPGYWNGILSLWLNGQSPRSEYATETAKAQRYFERSKAAELLAELDRRFPAAPERASLHAQMVQAVVPYGQPDAVIHEGKQFLADFPSASERFDVADAIADAYAQKNDTQDEFSLYESQLAELAAKTGGFPLTAANTQRPPSSGSSEFVVSVERPEAEDTNGSTALHMDAQALAAAPQRKTLPEASAYSRVLERYLGRLTATGQLPRALKVLRQQLDRNPSDPLLYERLSTFLQQNDLSAQQEQVFQLAIAKFQQPGYYDKLARFYLTQNRAADFGKLTRQVTEIFSGTELDTFFERVTSAKPIGPQLALELNLYAAKRFPHDEAFTRNLLVAYQAPVTRDAAAYEALLRQQWWVSAEFRDQFFAYLSRTGKLQAELSALAAAASAKDPANNPAAVREQAEIDVYTSHFEQAAPLLQSVAALYPADADIGDSAVSLFRSLAYLDPTTASTQKAVAIEQNLLRAMPDGANRLATLGDLYAEATSTGGEDLVSAEPFWRRIPQLHPGSSQGFLNSATILWDYFQFDGAMAEITRARQQFHTDVLFGYEAGAIAENQHDMQRAIDEYVNAAIHPLDVHRHFDSGAGVIEAWLRPPSDAADSNFRSAAQSFFGSEQAHARLMQLAMRKATHDRVDAATAHAAAANPSSLGALGLRADVLVAQHAPAEAKPLLTSLFVQGLDHASTVDAAQAVGALAQARGLTQVYEEALAKQALLTPDPLQKIELQYTLARSLESHKDVAGASRIMNAVYTANPRILGVVRATTEFYDRTGQPQKAVSTLLEAAKVAVPSLAHDFTLEAASRANQAGDTAQARRLATEMLAQSPYDARVLAVVAESYARAHDDAGLKQFYLGHLDAAAHDTALEADARRQNVALLRRGLIPALDRMHDFAGAEDQYIALLSAYPDDEKTAAEAALFAQQHGQQARLLDFLRTTVKQSSHDSRFMVLLAEVEQTFGDLPAAENAYSLAIDIRKDRSDLYIARADIETRLSQTDPSQSELVAKDFERLYVLTYHDPQWMVRLAELRARQGRSADAVLALKAAYITGHPETASDFFTVAEKLSTWNMLEDARSFAEHGVKLSGTDLLAVNEASSYSAPMPTGAVTYARILTRLGMAPQAVDVLVKARDDANAASYSPSVIASALEKESIGESDADAFRQSFAKRRAQIADQNLHTALNALGAAVQTYYTPEQKQTLALALDKLRTMQQPHAAPELAIEIASASGLTDREAAWRREALLKPDAGSNSVAEYSTLQRRRLQFGELAQTLERHAALLPQRSRRPLLLKAAQAYRDAGDVANEMRLSRALVLAGAATLQDRYFDLLLHRDPRGLLTLAASTRSELADAVVNYAIAHATEEQALLAISSRAQAVSPLWHHASAALAETYFAGSPSSLASTADFTQALGSDATIAERLATQADPKQQLTGTDFFFYASRFGIFLQATPKAAPLADAEDFLAAKLEAEPSAPASYLDLARTYAEAGNIQAASAEFRHALELSPSDPAILDEFATTLFHAGQHDEAKAQWSAALAQLRRMQQAGRYPESWFTDFETITQHLGERHLAGAFRVDLESIVGPYLAENGTYRSNELLKAIYQAADSPEEGTSFVLTLASAAGSSQYAVLVDLDGATWVTPDLNEAILLRQISLPDLVDESSTEVPHLGARLKLIELDLAQNRVTQAQAVFDALPDQAKKGKSAADGVVLAVRSHHMEALLRAWQADPDSAPKPEVLAAAVASLQKDEAHYTPDPAAIRPLQEFLFEQKDRMHTLVPTDFLSLAQARVDTKDVAGALELLQRLSLLPAATDASASAFATVTPAASPYDNLDHAAALLERAHLFAEALPFLRSLVRLTPWDASFRLRLSTALVESGAKDEARTVNIALARDAHAPYDLRVQAAQALARLTPQSSVDLGSAELTLIAKPTTAQAAQQPYFAAARIAAASLPSAAAMRETLLRESLAIRPTGADADHARVALFLLQPATANPSAVLALFDSLDSGPATSPPVGDQVLAGGSDDTGATTATIEGAGDAVNRSDNEIAVRSATLPPALRSADAATVTKVALMMSTLWERDDNLTAAAFYAQLAVDSAKEHAAAAAKQRLAHLNVLIRLEQRNAARRPVLHKDLAQTVPVRPRLSESSLQQMEAR